jgi:peptidyl-prolyl cis-trans isomerase SurA
MKTKFIILIYLFTFYPIQAQEVLDKIVAIVNNEIILISEIEQSTRYLSLQLKVDSRLEPEKYQELKKATLQSMIDQKILLAKAQLDSIQVDNKRVEEVMEQNVKQMIERAGSEEKLEEYYGQSLKKIKRDYKNEVKKALMVEELKRKKFQNLKVSRREVEEFFESNKDSLPELPATVDINHILINPSAGERALNNAYTRARAILDKLNKGEDFSKLASEYSDDSGTASRGGELGFFQRGDFIKEFEETAFTLNPGEISDIVKTKFGLHIIQLIERRGEKINVRQILITVKPNEQDEQTAIDTLIGIRDQIKKGKSWSEMALKYSNDPEVKENRGHLGEFETESLQIPEFKVIVEKMKVGEISEPFKTRFGYHIVLLNNRKEMRKVSLTGDWDKVQIMALNHKQNQEYQKWLNELRKEIYINIKTQL